MKRFVILGSAVLAVASISTTANACTSIDHQVVIYPVMQEAPKSKVGKVFKVRYSGERSGQTNKLWPNFYVVDVISGKMKGKKLAIPAHVTSCHSIEIAVGAEGYVIGNLQKKGRDGETLETPILSTMMNGHSQSKLLGMLKGS